MPDPLTQRLYQVLTADAPLAGLISNYMGLPAVFTTDPVPENAEFPYVWMRGASQNFRDDTLDKNARVVSRDIVAFALETGDPTPIDDIAWRISEIFEDEHGSALINGFGGMPDPGGGAWYPNLVQVGGPIDSSSDTETYGRSVELTITMEKV